MATSQTRARVYASHRFNREPRPRCPWCLGEIKFTGAWDVHEAIIKRGVIPKDRQDHIFTVENCVASHHSCHMWYGQTEGFLTATVMLKKVTIGLEAVVEWHKEISNRFISIRGSMEQDPFQYLQIVTGSDLMPTEETVERWQRSHPAAFTRMYNGITVDLPTMELGELV